MISLAITFSLKKSTSVAFGEVRLTQKVSLTLIAVSEITNNMPFRKIPRASTMVIWGKEK